MLRGLWTVLMIAQTVLGIRVAARLLRTARGETISPASSAGTPRQVAVVIPVLNERDRLGPCLEGLVGQGDVVAEILVVDGGSDDGTQQIVAGFAGRDSRVRLIDASPIPRDWNGKAWGLQVGLEQATADWILTIDADVRPKSGLAAALMSHANERSLKVFSVATQQEIGDAGEGLLHPSMLATLVYRFGIPGGRYRRVDEVQANGQCFLARRDVLESIGGFAAVRDSICEDITLARMLVEAGHEVGFFEAGDLVSVRMYPDWQATWRNWPRSLPMRDRYFGARGVVGLAEVLLVQALPIPLLALVGLSRARSPGLAQVNLILLVTRLGILAGTARAYTHRPVTYWLSPLADLPVALRLIASAMQREHTWRGRVLVRGGDR